MAKSPAHLEFGSYTKSLRIKAGLTQADLARELGYSNSQFVSNWERGLCLPAVSTLTQISGLLRVPTKTLFNKYMQSLKGELWKKASGSDCASR